MLLFRSGVSSLFMLLIIYLIWHPVNPLNLSAGNIFIVAIFILYINNYKSNENKFQKLEPCMKEHLHFPMAGHDGLLNGVSIVLIDKTDPANPLWREDYWRQKLKTMFVYGLNTEVSV